MNLYHATDKMNDILLHPNLFILVYNLFYKDKIIKTYNFLYSILLILFLKKYLN